MELHKVCCICGADKKVCNTKIGLLCGKHYLQYHRYGEIKRRTRYDKNEIILKDGYAVIVLYNSKGEPIAETIIDIEDIDKIKNYKWCLDKHNYVKNSQNKYLHRIVLDAVGLYVDHINGNTLDNRKSNLRICTNADNLKNRTRIPKSNTSGIIGVRFREDRKKWYAELQADNIVHRLGSYATKEEAVRARREAEIKYFGEYKSQIV